MKKMIVIHTTLIVLLLTIIFTGCQEPEEYDIRGTWDYVKYYNNNSVVWDNGTITFVGEPTSGDWTGYGFYGYEYTGTYIVSGTQVVLDGDGDEDFWTGSFIDETHMEGSWQANDTSGTWTAVMQ